MNSPATMTGQLSYGKMLPVLLGAGAGGEYGIVRPAFIVFRKTDGAIAAGGEPCRERGLTEEPDEGNLRATGQSTIETTPQVPELQELVEALCG